MSNKKRMQILVAEVENDSEIQELQLQIAALQEPIVSKNGIRLYKSSIKTNLELLQRFRGAYNKWNVKFVLESFLFLASHSSSFNALRIFSDAGFTDINKFVEARTLHKRWSSFSVWGKEFFQLMTSANLPLLSSNMQLHRCMYSTDVFSPLDAEYFDSYRTVSTSLSKGTCIGGHEFGQKTQGRIMMYLNCPHIPGLLINFQSLVKQTDEYEVILPPGLRFTWNKTAVDDLQQRMGLKFQHEDNAKNFSGGEYRIQYTKVSESESDSESESKSEKESESGSESEHESKGEKIVLFEHHRIYDVTFIPKPTTHQFMNANIAHRVAILRKAINMLNNILEKHKKKIVQIRMREFLRKTQLKAQQRRKLASHHL